MGTKAAGLFKADGITARKMRDKILVPTASDVQTLTDSGACFI